MIIFILLYENYRGEKAITKSHCSGVGGAEMEEQGHGINNYIWQWFLPAGLSKLTIFVHVFNK
jgi:hypothetical protein